MKNWFWIAFWLVITACSRIEQNAPDTTQQSPPKITNHAEGLILFENNGYLWVMTADGKYHASLSRCKGTQPCFSPDGRTIAYSVLIPNSESAEIFIADADGRKPKRLVSDDFYNSSPEWSPDGQKIAFEAVGGAYNSAIYIMNTDGSAITPLTTDDHNNRGPSWSPDGSKIAFSSSRIENYKRNCDIYIMNADGSKQTRLTADDANDWGPAWSPDGSRIAFSSNRDGNSEIYTIKADGTGLRKLTHSCYFNAYGPVWFPDGSKIAFVSYWDQERAICIMNADGSGRTRLTQYGNYGRPSFSPMRISGVLHDTYGHPIRESLIPVELTAPKMLELKFKMPAVLTDASSLKCTEGVVIYFLDNRREEMWLVTADGKAQADLGCIGYNPAFSPDGKKVAFNSTRDGNYEIYVMNPDGSTQTRLTNTEGSNIGPSWSPDGTKIAFVSERDGDSKIYVMNADGSAQTRLTNNITFDTMAVWSPDGQKIAYMSSRSLGSYGSFGNFDICIMNADGSGKKRLTHSDAEDSIPAWSPDGKKIAFHSNRGDGFNYDIYTMNADGSDQKRLTTNKADDYGPVWSPSGEEIAFYVHNDNSNKIYVMKADGSGQKQLTSDDSDAWAPIWSPDGSKIFYLSARDVFVMNADGSEQMFLTESGDCHSPSLSPVRMNGVLYDIYGHVIKE